MNVEEVNKTATQIVSELYESDVDTPDTRDWLHSRIARALRAAAREADRQGDMAEAADTATERVYDKLRAGVRVVWGPDGAEVGTVKLHEDDGDSSVGISASRWYEIELDEPLAAAIKNATGQTGNPFVAMFGEQADRAMRVAGAEVQPAAMRPPPGHIIDETGAVRRVLGTLPVTKDGCVVGGSCLVWARYGRFFQPMRTLPAETTSTPWEAGVAISSCYSTEESAIAAIAAAEAARGAEG